MRGYRPKKRLLKARVAAVNFLQPRRRAWQLMLPRQALNTLEDWMEVRGKRLVFSADSKIQVFQFD